MEQEQSLFEEQMDAATINEFSEFAKWARMTCIFLYIICGVVILMIILAAGKMGELFAGANTEVSPGALSGVLIFAVVFVVALASIVLFFLIRGTNRIRLAIPTKNQIQFNSGLNDIRIYFSIVGVLSILSLVFSLFSFI